jgi:predicted O-methyltransferase YrrM
MQFEKIIKVVEGIPFISPDNARLLYDAVIDGDRRRLLELGFAHGAATCVMAAALDELGQGEVVAVDLESARVWQQPGVEELLARSGLSQYVTIVREATSYTWYLRNELRARVDAAEAVEGFDLCIIDGPKNWTIDGAAFLMADRLLRPGALLVLDDVDWTYAAADASRDATDGIAHRELSDAERRTPHVRDIAELLVMQHPSYRDFVFTDTDWFLATKSSAANQIPRVVRHQVVTHPSDVLRRRVLGLMRSAGRVRARA